MYNFSRNMPERNQCLSYTVLERREESEKVYGLYVFVDRCE